MKCLSPQWFSKKEGEGIAEAQRNILLYRSSGNIFKKMIHWEKQLFATHRVVSESGKDHPKMIKPFGEMLLGAGESVGVQVSPLWWPGSRCALRLPGPSVTTVTKRSRKHRCLLMRCETRAQNHLWFTLAKRFDLNLTKSWTWLLFSRKAGERGTGPKQHQKTDKSRM